MWQYLQHLSAQQTTAPELATFLVLVTIACIAVAALIYVAIMTVAWAVALRRYRWREAVFPTLPRLRVFTGEYILAALTSVVLAVTLVEKDTLVDAVLNLPADKFLDSHLTASLFPLNRLPDAVDLGGPSLAQEARNQASLTLGGFVREPLDLGRTGPVRALLGAMVRQVLATSGTSRADVARWLTILTVVLILAYLAWLARGRIAELAKGAGDVDSPYKDVFARVTILGVCLALLLATPAITKDPELLADSALGAAQRRPPEPRLQRLDSLVALGITRQNAVQATQHTGNDPAIYQLLAALRGRVDGIDARLAGLSDQTRAIAALRDSLELLRTRGLLLVYVGAGLRYAVTAIAAGKKPRVVASDTTLGLHWIPPGRYLIAAQRMQTDSVIIGAGQAITVRLKPLQ